MVPLSLPERRYYFLSARSTGSCLHLCETMAYNLQLSYTEANVTWNWLRPSHPCSPCLVRSLSAVSAHAFGKSFLCPHYVVRTHLLSMGHAWGSCWWWLGVAQGGRIEAAFGRRHSIPFRRTRCAVTRVQLPVTAVRWISTARTCFD